MLPVADPALAGSPGWPGGLLGGGGRAGEAGGPCLHGNTDLAAAAQEEKCERCREHR